jgi:predicted ATPase
MVKQTGEQWFSAELNRHKGQLLHRREHAEAAEELYCKALNIGWFTEGFDTPDLKDAKALLQALDAQSTTRSTAREQEAKLWELRAAASLARLWRDQGRRLEARELLAPVYQLQRFCGY